jgi:hypothetical protein
LFFIGSSHINERFIGCFVVEISSLILFLIPDETSPFEKKINRNQIGEDVENIKLILSFSNTISTSQ